MFGRFRRVSEGTIRLCKDKVLPFQSVICARLSRRSCPCEARRATQTFALKLTFIARMMAGHPCEVAEAFRALEPERPVRTSRRMNRRAGNRLAGELFIFWKSKTKFKEDKKEKSI